MRVCVLSNSHGASLKHALDTGRFDDSGVNFSLFALPKYGMKRIRPLESDSKLGSENKQLANMLYMTSGGASVIELDNFDSFFLHGLDLIPPRLDRRHSRAMAMASVEDMIAPSGALYLAELIRRVSDAPILVSPEPLRADQEVENKTHVAPNGPSQPEYYGTIMSMVMTSFPVPGVHWVLQRPETIGERLSTLRAFSTNSTRLDSDVSHKKGDTRHMNGAYGEIVLDDVIAKLQSDLG